MSTTLSNKPLKIEVTTEGQDYLRARDLLRGCLSIFNNHHSPNTGKHLREAIREELALPVPAEQKPAAPASCVSCRLANLYGPPVCSECRIGKTVEKIGAELLPRFAYQTHTEECDCPPIPTEAPAEPEEIVYNFVHPVPGGPVLSLRERLGLPPLHAPQTA